MPRPSKKKAMELIQKSLCTVLTDAVPKRNLKIHIIFIKKTTVNVSIGAKYSRRVFFGASLPLLALTCPQDNAVDETRRQESEAPARALGAFFEK